jgi:hypothetical protein
VGPEGALDVVAAWRHNSELRKFEPDGDLQGEILERPQWSDVQFRLNDRTTDGGILTAVQPINDKENAVLVVTRTEVK